MRLTLLIPELLWSEPGDTEANAPAATSALAKILAQRHFARQSNVGWESSLIQLAGLHADSALAVLRLAGETDWPTTVSAQRPALSPDQTVSEDEARRWLCADPVHLRFHQDRLILADGQELGLTREELHGLNARLNAAFADRAEFFLFNPTRGYVRLIEPPQRRAHGGQALSRKIGCEVRPEDFGDDAEIRGLANEVQMFLHADPVNQQRATQGRPAINALWLWGSGEPPRVANPADQDRPDTIYGSHPLMHGIAQQLGLDAPTLGDRSPLSSPPARHALCLLDALSTPTHYQNSLDYAAHWRTLDQTHLSPALKALRQWRLRQLHVIAPVVFGELHWQLKPLAGWPGPHQLLSRTGRKNWFDLINTLATQTVPNTSAAQRKSGSPRNTP